ncbi:MAG TPA: hypothetical protein VGH32_09965, partial [Pirellulales bacterium]
PMSRLHLGIGAMSYLSSPLLMLSLVLSFLSVALPKWRSNAGAPSAAADSVQTWGAGLFLATIALLLLPKVWSYLVLVRDRRRSAQLGGPVRIAASAIVETMVSIVVAPIMMAFHSVFVVATLLGKRVSWNAQERDERGLPLAAAFSAHWKQTVAGLAAGLAAWQFAPRLFLWLSPIFVGLVLAVPLSVLLSSTAVGRWMAARGLLLIPEETTGNKLLERRRQLLSIVPGSKPADTDLLFRRVLAEPAMLELHCSILEATSAGVPAPPRTMALVERQLLSGGAARVSVENRKTVLGDSTTLRALHVFAWSSPKEG